MMRFKYHSLLILLILLVISCDPNSELKRELKSGGTPRSIRVSDQRSDRDIKVKLKDLFVEFELSDEEKQVVDKIKSIVTNPNIGKDEGYRTYNDLEFYNLLKTLGSFRVKKIVENYLRVDDLKDNVQEVFKQALTSGSSVALKERVDDKLNAYNSSHEVQLKGLFSYSDANFVYGAITNGNYVDQAVIKTNARLDKLKAGNVYLQLDSGEQRIIDQVRTIVTTPSKFISDSTYKLRTVQEFYGLLNTLDVDKVKEIVKSYKEYEDFKDAEYEEINKSIELVTEVESKEELGKELDNAHLFYDFHIKRVFTKFDDENNILDDLPEPNDVYEGMTQPVYRSIFDFVKYQVQDIRKYEEIEGNLSISQMVALAYMSDNSGHSEFNLKWMLGRLGFSKAREILDFHVKVITAEDQARKTLNSVKDVKKKEALQAQFDQYVEDYHKHLRLCLAYNDPDRFYDQVIEEMHMKNFKKVKADTLALLK